jgi:molybdate transport system substrate-binding protein
MNAEGFRWARGGLVIALLTAAQGAWAGEMLLAVAANFTPVAEALAREFGASSGHRIRLTSGSTGKLYAQIVNGAPFDVFLAADRERPLLLETRGQAVSGSRFTYAAGRLVIWLPDDDLAHDASGEDAMSTLGSRDRIAIANADLAPYGLAAEQVLQRFGLPGAERPLIVRGENVAQAYAMVASGAADGGLVALSLLRDRVAANHYRAVPAEWHDPIRKDAVLLQHGADNEAARAFLTYLKSPAARQQIVGQGFDVPS